MDDILTPLESSVGIVKRWGVFKLPNGKTLAEQLTFQGFSFWEIMEPYLVLYDIPLALSGNVSKPSILKKLKPYISLAKRNYFNSKKVTQGKSKGKELLKEGAFLFLGFSEYMYRDVLHPVATHLAVKKMTSLAIHDGTVGKSIIPSELVAYQSIWQHWDSSIKTDADALKKQMQDGIDELRAMNILPQIVNDGEMKLWPQMEAAFNWLFKFHMPLLVPQIALARHILKKHKPSLIFSAAPADTRARIYSLLARQLNIPVMEIQFGPSGAEGVEWRFVVADYIAVWGKSSLEVLVDHHIPAEKITITGSSRHDSLINVSVDEIAHTRERLNVPKGQAMVLCASTYQQKEYDYISDPELLISMKRAAFEAADKVTGVCLVVKPHPLENVNDTKKLIGDAKNVLLVDIKENITQLTKCCDAFIGFGSTATVDALIANKLTICPAFNGWVWSDQFVKSNTTVVPRNEEEVLSIFQKITDGSYKKIMAELDGVRREYLNKLVYITDGHSSERIANLAIEMVTKDTVAV